MTKTIGLDLTKGNVTKQLFIFSTPFIIANLLQVCYNLVDMMIVGQFVGSTGISAVSNGGDLLMMFTNIGIGFATAGQISISQFIGSNRKDRIQSMIGTMFLIIISMAILLSIGFLPFTTSLLELINVPQESLSMANDYLVIGLFGLVFIFGYNTVSAILRGMGDSKRPLLFVAISATINVILDLILIGIFDMKTTGAAIATVTGQAISFIIAIIYLYKKREQFGFDFKREHFTLNHSNVKTLFTLGIPMSLQFAAINISVLFVTSFINTYGVIISAVTGVGNKIGQIAMIVTNGLSTAGSSMIGQSFGAQDFDRVKKIVYKVFLMGLLFSLIISVVVWLFPEFVFSLFDQTPEVLAMAPTYAIIIVLNFMGAAVRAPILSLINGIGFSSMNFIMGFIDGFIVRIGLALLLGITFNMGVMGFWLGSVLAGFTYGFIITPYFLSGRWKKRSVIQ